MNAKLLFLLLIAVITSCDNTTTTSTTTTITTNLSNDTITDNTAFVRSPTVNQLFGDRRLNNSQKFIYVNNKGFTYKGKGGTVLIFPPNVFNCSNKDSVKITICEFADLSAMVKANLSTTSNGKMLETNGMVYCKAYSNNKELTLKKGESFTCMFNKAKKEDYKLFAGVEQEGNINWTNPVAPAPKIIPTSKMKPVQGDIKIDKEALYISAYGTENDIGDVETPLQFITEPKTHLTAWFFNKYDITYMDLIPLAPDASIGLQFLLTKAGKLVFKSSDISLNSKIKSKLIGYFEKMPVMNGYVNKSTGAKEDLLIFVTITPDKLLADKLGADNGNMNIINKAIAQKEAQETALQLKKEELENERITQNNIAIEKRTKEVEEGAKSLITVKKIIFKATAMGWINCDRFYNDPRSKVDILFTNVEGYSSYNIQVVFTSIRSILSVSSSIANNIPVNEPLKIIFVGMKNNDVHFYTKNMAASETGNEMVIAATKIDPNELDKYIQKSLN